MCRIVILFGKERRFCSLVGVGWSRAGNETVSSRKKARRDRHDLVSISWLRLARPSQKKPSLMIKKEKNSKFEEFFCYNIYFLFTWSRISSPLEIFCLETKSTRPSCVSSLSWLTVSISSRLVTFVSLPALGWSRGNLACEKEKKSFFMGGKRGGMSHL